MNQTITQTLTVAAAAEVLGVSESSVRRAARRGDLPTVAIPGIKKVLFPRDWVEDIARGGPDLGPADRPPEAAQLGAARSVPDMDAA